VAEPTPDASPEKTQRDSFEINRKWQPYLYANGKIPDHCPRCRQPLHMERYPYVIATRRATRLTDTIIAGGPATGFCEDCEIAAVDETQVQDLIRRSGPKWDVGDEYVILGLVDLDAVPEDKRHLPFNDDNPPPLIFFEKARKDLSDPRTRRRRRKRNMNNPG
jgi:hypothetical protein